jgi:hypothetical protein
MPSLSPKGRSVDYSPQVEARRVDYSYLDQFKPPPVQYQTSRWVAGRGEAGRPVPRERRQEAARLSPQTKVGTAIKESNQHQTADAGRSPATNGCLVKNCVLRSEGPIWVIKHLSGNR